jgi:hypothetical protein
MLAVEQIRMIEIQKDAAKSSHVMLPLFSPNFFKIVAAAILFKNQAKDVAKIDHIISNHKIVATEISTMPVYSQDVVVNLLTGPIGVLALHHSAAVFRKENVNGE